MMTAGKGAIPKMNGFVEIATLIFAVGAFVCALLALRRGGASLGGQMERLRREFLEESRNSRQETAQSMGESIRNLGDILARSQSGTAQAEDRRLTQLSEQLTQRQDTLQHTVSDLMKAVDKRLADAAVQEELKLDGIRTTVEHRLGAMQEDNGRRLDEMRATVDEKLQKTLNERIGQSFQIVSERLEQVYKGLGEMQTLAEGVGDLKKVLGNVKTRGVLGEVQLGAILEQVLSPEQYGTNVVTKKGSRDPVEYAVRMPGNDSGAVWLPIDAKFPADAYSDLCDAYDTGDGAAVAQAGTVLEQRIKRFAKDIRDKYIDPPATTDFGVMFLPFEGLYAEVVRRGLLETLQRDYRVTVAGPTTMAALLNSLQMGFRTLAIQKRSGEVWQLLGAVKTEFGKFGDVLESARRRLDQTNQELDKLVGARTRQIQRRLAQVQTLPEAESAALLDAGEAPSASSEE